MMSTASVMLDILSRYDLKEDESYNMYLLRPDGWPWGYHGNAKDPEQISAQYDEFVNNPEFIGIWITKESDDGTTDTTIFKWYKGVI